MFPAAPASAERRAAIRTSVDCPVRVRAAQPGDRRSGVDAIVVGLSATGLDMFVTARLYEGEHLFAVVPLPSGARVAVRGYVARVEMRGASYFEVAMQFTRTRLLPAAADGTTVGLSRT